MNMLNNGIKNINYLKDVIENMEYIFVTGEHKSVLEFGQEFVWGNLSRIDGFDDDFLSSSAILG